jgi:hypothetical protein
MGEQQHYNAGHQEDHVEDLVGKKCIKDDASVLKKLI